MLLIFRNITLLLVPEREVVIMFYMRCVHNKLVCILLYLISHYKSLTTDNEQRVSFRSHIINAVVNTLTPAKVNIAAGDAEDGWAPFVFIGFC